MAFCHRGEKWAELWAQEQEGIYSQGAGVRGQGSVRGSERQLSIRGRGLLAKRLGEALAKGSPGDQTLRMRKEGSNWLSGVKGSHYTDPGGFLLNLD